MTEPTDAELLAEWDRVSHMADAGQRRLACLRAVLAKWGTPPAVAGEPVGWMWQHDETGRTGFVDCWQVENGWQENNPRLRLISKLYTTPQPTQAQAGAVPLKYARLHAISLDYSDSEDECTGFRDGWRAAEKHHGIKGADHA